MDPRSTSPHVPALLARSGVDCQAHSHLIRDPDIRAQEPWTARIGFDTLTLRVAQFKYRSAMVQMD